MDLSTQEAKETIEKNKDNKNFTVLDVRTPEEFSEGHIENAININIHNPEFKNILNKLDKTKTFLVHCRTGVRSSNAVSLMKDLKFTNILHMCDGIESWENNNLPTTKEQ